MEQFKVGDKVEWVSSGSGTAKNKTGVVVGIVPVNMAVRKAINIHGAHFYRVMFDVYTYNNRKGTSYLVRVEAKTKEAMPLLYWPRTNKLRLIDDGKCD